MALSTWPIMADARHRHFAFAEVALRFGIHVSNCGDFHDIRATAHLAREAEDAGWNGFFRWDHIRYGKSNEGIRLPPAGGKLNPLLVHRRVRERQADRLDSLFAWCGTTDKSARMASNRRWMLACLAYHRTHGGFAQ